MHAAAELPDATIVKVRMFDLFGRVCSSCTACVGTGRCSRHHAALDETIAKLASTDALLVGCAGHLHARDIRCQALLERLVGAFGNIETARGLERTSCPAGGRKRAAVICGAPPFMGIPVMLGMLPSGAAGVWRMLERADARIVGCATVSAGWAGPASRDRAGESARRLGRSLAAPAGPRRTGGQLVPDGRKVAAALLSTARGA
jgi:hypothetical protein